ncbi:MAG: hypothetical protein M1825_003111 [Sarcosagium campestre]|nr:MAG: hypothetical protein M1825_003111 [Sarcosagium campestre]
MPAPSRLFATDEELGKRDDDLKLGQGSVTLSPWTLWPRRYRIRRRRLGQIVLALLFVFMVYKSLMFDAFQSIQVVDDNIISDSEEEQLPHESGKFGKDDSASDAHKPVDVAEPKHDYSGPIKFHKLASSLHAITRTAGWRKSNRNVLFVASNLKSAAIMIPMACEMGRWRRNYVHFAFVGRDEMSLPDILDLNGVGSHCEISWHDGRPDSSAISSELRMRVSVGAALGHIQNYMHPQAVLIDNSGREDDFFIKSAKSKAKDMGMSLIELPANAAEKMMWISRLDSDSLKAWNRAEVEILIHSPPESSGGISRLLKSLQRADYFGCTPPKLTIELPAAVDPSLQQYLSSIRWPPTASDGDTRRNEITLRHRINRRMAAPDEASVRFLESFYPTDPTNSHVLVLSPQVELSPLYYHYLRYTLLEYAHSSFASEASNKRMLGISLDKPPTYLNGSTRLTPPTDLNFAIKNPTSSTADSDDRPPPFLWQAPNSDAALYFGNKWVELHDFLGNRLEPQRATRSTSPKSKKLVSKQQPAWLEYVLELVRARGYYMLYPHFEDSDALATVHNELHHTPEEFAYSALDAPSSSSSSSSSSDNDGSSSSSNHKNANGDDDDDDEDPGHMSSSSSSGHSTFVADPSTYLSTSGSPAAEPEPFLTSQTQLLHLLPNDGDLPEAISLPLLSHDGHRISPSLHSIPDYASTFRRLVGGCNDPMPRKPSERSTTDLFCDDTGADFDDVEIEPRVVRARPSPVPVPATTPAVSRSELGPGAIPAVVKAETH